MEQASGWEAWAQQIGGGLLQTYANAKFNQPYELQKLQLQAYGQGAYGLPYIQGQPNGTVGVGLPSGWLLIGAVVLAVVMIKS